MFVFPLLSAENNLFLNNITNDVQHKKQWIDKDESPLSMSEAELHKRNIMLGVRWNHREIIPQEF